MCVITSQNNNNLKSFASLVIGRYLAAVESNEVINGNTIIGKDSLGGNAVLPIFRNDHFCIVE